MAYQIIIIEPDRAHLAVIKKTLEYVPKEYQFHFLNTPVEVIQMLQKDHIDVIICELITPIISSLEIFRMCEILTPDTKRILLTDASDMHQVLDLINEVMAFRIIMKPCKLAEDIMLPVNQSLVRLEAEKKEKINTAECKNAMQALDDKYQVLKRAYVKNNSDFQMIYQIIAGAFRGNLADIAGEEKQGSLEDFLQKIFLWYVVVNYSDCKGYAAQYQAFLDKFHRPEEKKMVDFNPLEELNCKIEDISRIFYAIYLLTGMYDSFYQHYQVHISMKETEEAVGIICRMEQNASKSEDGTPLYVCGVLEERIFIEHIVEEVLHSVMKDVDVKRDSEYDTWKLTWIK